MEFLKRKITKEQSRDTGMAIVFLFCWFSCPASVEGWLFTAMVCMS